VSEAVIRELVARNPGQATFEEYKLVYDTLAARAPCNMLVFGVGRDTPLWMTTNAGGTTVFLENNARWIQVSRELSPGIVVHQVRYPTLRALAPLLRHVPWLLRTANVPRDVWQERWDVILVDAPRGTRWYRPGRAMSVYTASLLARRAARCDVFVHDTHRATERHAGDWFLGADALVEQRGTMRHYRVSAPA
jgi:glucuronoxylan 4-O-methyltransferase